MGKINWSRVILGGLLAGVVINLFEFATNAWLLARDWDAAMRALGRHMDPAAIKIFVALGFLSGIAAILLYAVARPRFGAGPKTAVLTGLIYWVIGYALPTIGWAPMGLIPVRLLAIGTLVGLVEIAVASVAGAWLYKQ